MTLKLKYMLTVVFAFISLNLFTEEYKIMSFNIRYGNNRNDWYEYFGQIIAYTKDRKEPDVLLVQEISSENNGIEKVHQKLEIGTYACFSTEKYFANKSYINQKTGINYSGTGHHTQHNAIFVNKKKFSSSEDLARKLGFYTPETTDFPSDFNNFQCIKLTTNDNKILIIVNTHVRPKDKQQMKYMTPGNIQSRDTIKLRELLYKMQKDYPNAVIIAGGDFNYSYKVLTSEWADGKKLSYGWIVDPGLSPSNMDDEFGLQTTYNYRPWDHFICYNIKKINKKFSIALEYDNTGSEETKVGSEWLTSKKFNKKISDHWPVSFSFDY